MRLIFEHKNEELRKKKRLRIKCDLHSNTEMIKFKKTRPDDTMWKDTGENDTSLDENTDSETNSADEGI